MGFQKSMIFLFKKQAQLKSCRQFKILSKFATHQIFLYGIPQDIRLLHPWHLPPGLLV